MNKFIFTLVLLIFNFPAFPQNSSLDLKWKDGKVRGFSVVESNSIPVDVIKRLIKLEKKFKYDAQYDDTLKYFKNSFGNFGVRFISTYYEMTFIVSDSQGKWIRTITCLNPEFEDFSNLNDRVKEIGYNFESSDSPENTVYKYVTTSNRWFEASVIKEGNDSTRSLIVFDKNYQFIRSEEVK